MMRNALPIPDWVLEKMKKYCAYQERCLSEVKWKLREFHLQEGMDEQVILELERENYLDEARYAREFARSKLRANKWGRNKIYAALQQKKVPELFILEGLAGIEEEDYLEVLRSVIGSKTREVRDPDDARRKGKVATFAIGKGFEPPLVWDLLNKKE